MQAQGVRTQIDEIRESLAYLEAIARENEAARFGAPVAYHQQLLSLLHDARERFSTLESQIIGGTGEKKVNADSVVNKVLHYCVAESQKLGVDLSLASQATGQLSINSAEVFFGAALPAIKFAVQTLGAQKLADRKRAQLFAGPTFLLRLVADHHSVFFSLECDSLQPLSAAWSNRMRDYVSKFGGWCATKDDDFKGSKLEIKFPLPNYEKHCVLASIYGCIVGMPSTLVRSSWKLSEQNTFIKEEGFCYLVYGQEHIPVFAADQKHGLKPLIDPPSAAENCQLAVLSVADFSIVLVCGDISTPVTVQLADSQRWCEPGVWYRQLATYRVDAKDTVAPYISGEDILRTFKQYWSR